MNINSINHSVSKRIQTIKIKEEELDKLIFPFNKHSVQSLEYKPFSRFSLAKSIDDVFEGNLKALKGSLKAFQGFKAVRVSHDRPILDAPFQAVSTARRLGAPWENLPKGSGYVPPRARLRRTVFRPGRGEFWEPFK